MTTVLRWWRTYGKAHIAFIGGVLTFVATAYPDTPLGRYAGLLVAALTAVGVIAAPHKSKAPDLHVGTATVKITPDIDHLLDGIASALHTAGDNVTAAKPKTRRKRP